MMLLPLLCCMTLLNYCGPEYAAFCSRLSPGPLQMLPHDPSGPLGGGAGALPSLTLPQACGALGGSWLGSSEW